MADGRGRIVGGAAAVAAAAAAALMLPGAPDSVLHGMPLGIAGAPVVAFAIVAAVLLRRTPVDRRVIRACTVALVALTIGRVAAGRAIPPQGWVASYYGNTDWSGTPEWSSDFRGLGATRIDPQISFHGDAFPVYYLNGTAFDRGVVREVGEPMSVTWVGSFELGAREVVHAEVVARGHAVLEIDSRPVIDADASDANRTLDASVPLPPGSHVVRVRYAKPADTDGRIDVRLTSAGQPLAIAPAALPPAPSALRVIASACALGILVILVTAVVAGGRELWRTTTDRLAIALPACLFVLFGLQGWWQARRFAGRFFTLTAGDDWWGFESSAREILQHGPLMTLGKPLGSGAPYFYHPLYCYFLAAVHAVTGESLFGPVFVQFLVLAVVAVAVWRLADGLFGRRASLAGLLVLVVLFEFDFIRYYTVTLLSENIYILTVTLAMVPFVRWMRTGERSDLAWMGFWGGVSAITRPAMMFYLFPALAMIALVSWLRAHRPAQVLLNITVAACAWFAAVAPVTARNLAVSHRFVLVSEVQSVSVLTYNIPPTVSAAEYYGRFQGTFASALHVIWEMTRDHPGAMFNVAARKIAFSLGLTQLIDGYRPHPELLGISALYLLMCAVSRRMRQREMWPIHLFALVHLASMLLTMPWNYGYRLIIPPFVYTGALGTAAAFAWWHARGASPAFGHREALG